MSLSIDDRVALLIGRVLIREQLLEMKLAEALAMLEEKETEDGKEQPPGKEK